MTDQPTSSSPKGSSEGWLCECGHASRGHAGQKRHCLENCICKGFKPAPQPISSPNDKITHDSGYSSEKSTNTGNMSTGDAVDELEAIVAFLCGAKDLDGMWFGEDYTDKGIPMFWWRGRLRKALANRQALINQAKLRGAKEELQTFIPSNNRYDRDSAYSDVPFYVVENRTYQERIAQIDAQLSDTANKGGKI